MTTRSRNILWALVAVLAGTLFVGGAIVVRRTYQVEAARQECAENDFHISMAWTPFWPDWADSLFTARHLIVWSAKSNIFCGDFGRPRPRLTDNDWLAILPTVRQLPRVTNIAFNNVVDIKITGRTLESLSAFPDLQFLDLSGAKEITDEDLATLSDVHGLVTLRLDNTQITGVGLAALESLTQLESLSLNGTPLTEEGVRAIGRLKSLQSISLSNTGLAESNVMELEMQLPGVMISDD